MAEKSNGLAGGNPAGIVVAGEALAGAGFDSPAEVSGFEAWLSAVDFSGFVVTVDFSSAAVDSFCEVEDMSTNLLLSWCFV